MNGTESSAISSNFPQRLCASGRIAWKYDSGRLDDFSVIQEIFALIISLASRSTRTSTHSWNSALLCPKPKSPA